mmetsp:Transcript_22983/g.58499  ORF Transcript_22983/g.58499 Transcript_22983/m.58499 type:complete len:150 (+) Transcript_22983:282-731(+)
MSVRCPCIPILPPCGGHKSERACCVLLLPRHQLSAEDLGYSPRHQALLLAVLEVLDGLFDGLLLGLFDGLLPFFASFGAARLEGGARFEGGDPLLGVIGLAALGEPAWPLLLGVNGPLVLGVSIGFAEPPTFLPPTFLPSVFFSKRFFL